MSSTIGIKCTRYDCETRIASIGRCNEQRDRELNAGWSVTQPYTVERCAESRSTLYTDDDHARARLSTLNRQSKGRLIGMLASGGYEMNSSGCIAPRFRFPRQPRHAY